EKCSAAPDQEPWGEGHPSTLWKNPGADPFRQRRGIPSAPAPPPLGPSRAEVAIHRSPATDRHSPIGSGVAAMQLRDRERSLPALPRRDPERGRGEGRARRRLLEPIEELPERATWSIVHREPAARAHPSKGTDAT